MDPFDLAVRNETYRWMAKRAVAPTATDIAGRLGYVAGHADVTEPDDVRDAWRRLHDAHALVLVDRGAAKPALRMLNPFSVVRTPHVVDADGRRFFANCGWDAFGIAVVLRSDATIHTTCPDCGEPIELEVRDYRPTDASPVFHVLVPARDWWNDIGFT